MLVEAPVWTQFCKDFEDSVTAEVLRAGDQSTSSDVYDQLDLVRMKNRNRAFFKAVWFTIATAYVEGIPSRDEYSQTMATKVMHEFFSITLFSFSK